MKRLTLGVVIVVLGVALFPLAAEGTTPTFFNGFETDNAGWNILGGQNDATRVPSGTHGVPSKIGSYHAEAAGPFQWDTGNGSAFTRWGGYGFTPGCGPSGCAAAFPVGGYTTSVDVYLDPTGLASVSTANDTRVEFDSAINDPAGSFRRDFVFEGGYYYDSDVTGSGPRFVFNAGNNAGRGSAYPKDPGHDPFAITTTGWYTLQHDFRDDGSGVLAVTLSIRDGVGNVLHSWIRSDPTDTINGTVGGNRYGFFLTNELPFLAFDNTQLRLSTPPPPFAISDFHYHACAGATCTSTDASSTVYRCTDVQLASPGCTVGADDYNAGTTKHSYLIHTTVANHTGGTLSSLKIQGGLTVSLLKSKPSYSIFFNGCGGTTKIDTSSKNNVITVSGATLANGSSCNLVVEMDGAQFGTSSGYNVAITGTWSASAKAETTPYTAGPTGRLEVHIF